MQELLVNGWRSEKIVNCTWTLISFPHIYSSPTIHIMSGSLQNAKLQNLDSFFDKDSKNISSFLVWQIVQKILP